MMIVATAAMMMRTDDDGDAKVVMAMPIVRSGVDRNFGGDADADGDDSDSDEWGGVARVAVTIGTMVARAATNLTKIAMVGIDGCEK